MPLFKNSARCLPMKAEQSLKTREPTGFMHYYVSKNHNRLNGKTFSPEKINPHVCLNPKYGADVRSTPTAKVLLDSGAFQDRQKDSRVSIQAALSRQLVFEEKQGFTSELLVSYDRLVDESEGTGRNKKRVAHATAKKYVEETIDAAKYLADEREQLNPRRIVLSCQGTTVPQYIGCLKEILKFAEPDDVIGFGGFCIVGQRKSLSDQFFKILGQALPLIHKKQIERVHLFGVGYFPVLVRAHVMCRKAGITASYDTSSYEFNGVLGRVFNPLAPAMSPVFMPKDKHSLYHPAEIAKFNIAMVSDFWRRLNEVEPVDEARLVALTSGKGKRATRR